jgi:hypothetical protein
MSRAVVFVGSVGVGKSTLINKLRGTDEAEIGNSDDKDGTSGIDQYQDTVDRDLVLIDTPGLDSNNFPAHVVEYVQKLNRKLIIVLVTSKRNTRITCKTKFEEILRDLIPTGAKFCSIQTFSDLDVQEFGGYLLTNFPSVPLHKDSDLVRFRASFSDPGMFHFPKANVAAVKAATAKAAIVVKPKKVKAAAASVKVKVPPGFPLGIPSFLDSPDAFKNRETKEGKFGDLCKEVVALKAEGSREFQICKLIGDAYLKPIVYCLIKKRNGDDAMLKTAAHRISDNVAGFAMPLFFDKHLAAKHNVALPNEQGISPHGKSDVVEALLELARRKRDTFAFMFIFEELFVLADMGSFVGK